MPLGAGGPGAPLAMSSRCLHAFGHWHNRKKRAKEEMKQRRVPGGGCEQRNAVAGSVRDIERDGETGGFCC